MRSCGAGHHTRQSRCHAITRAREVRNLRVDGLVTTVQWCKKVLNRNLVPLHVRLCVWISKILALHLCSWTPFVRLHWLIVGHACVGALYEWTLARGCGGFASTDQTPEMLELHMCFVPEQIAHCNWFTVQKIWHDDLGTSWSCLQLLGRTIRPFADWRELSR